MDSRYRANRPARCLLAALLGLLLVVAAMAAAFAPLMRFFQHNIWVNIPILAVFLVGVLLAFRNLFRLTREEQLANLVYRRTFHESRDGWSVEQLGDRLPASAVHTRVSQARELGARGGPAHEEVLAEISSSEEAARAAAVRYLVGILVFLGLLGTFAGLLLTVEGVRGIIAGMDLDPYADMEVYLRELRNDLSQPLEGMSTAFSTSLFGLGASVILGFLGMQLTRAQESFLAKLNDLTLLYLFPAFRVGAHVGVPAGSYNASAAALSTAGPAAATTEGPAGEGRALEAGARYLEAGARALQEDVGRLTEVVQRSEQGRDQLVATLREAGETLRRSAESLDRLEKADRSGRQELLRVLEQQARGAGEAARIEEAVRDLERKAGEILGRVEARAGGADEQVQALREQMQRETRILANHLTGGVGDLSELWDAAAREICRRITEGLSRVERSIREMDRGAGAPSSRSGPGTSGDAPASRPETGPSSSPPQGPSHRTPEEDS